MGKGDFITGRDIKRSLLSRDEKSYGEYIEGTSFLYIVENFGPSIKPLGTRITVTTLLTGTMQSVPLATSGNFAQFDSNGQLVDSGKKIADFLQVASNLTDVADRQAALDNLTDSASTTTDFILTRDSGGQAVWQANPVQPQTPWEQDIDGAGFSLTDVVINDFASTVHADDIHKEVRNETGGELVKGDLIYPSGFSIGQNLVLVQKADATSMATMPAIGMVEETIANNAKGGMVQSGKLSGIDTSSFSVKDSIYVTTTPGVFGVRPTGATDQVQSMGIVLRSHATLGEIEVVGAGRVNDSPNLQDGRIWIGSAANLAVPLAVSGDITISNAGVADISSEVVGDTEISSHTSTKITITDKSQLNSSIVYTDQANVFGNFAQTFLDNQLFIQNPAGTFEYQIVAGAIAADRVLNLPLLIGDDTIVTEAFIQTLTNKTIDADSNTVTNIGSSEVVADIISGQSLVTAAATDMVLIEDATDGLLKRVDAGDFIQAIVTADNGLTKTSNNIQLGGALTADTTVSGAFDLTFNVDSIAVGTTIGTTGFEIQLPSGGQIGTRSTSNSYTQYSDTNVVHRANDDHIFFTSGIERLRIADALITSSIDLTVKGDADANTILGRARIDSRVTDIVYFSHFDMSGAGQYALRQSSGGQTIINAASGQTASIRVGGAGGLTISAITITTNVDLNMSANSILIADRVGLNLTIGDVATPLEGQIWYNDTTNKFRVFENAAAIDMIGGGSGDMILASIQTVTGAKTFDAGTLLLNDTDSAFDLELGSTSTITTANKTLTFDVNDANRTLTISGDATITGSNTGDQTSIVGITGTKAEFDTAVTDGDIMYIGDAPTSHTHLLAAGATDVTATFGELNLLDLSGLTAGWVLSADSATTASWKAATGGSQTPWVQNIDAATFYVWDVSGIRDANELQLLDFSTVASAVNEFNISNNATGLAPIFKSQGEANIGIQIQDSNGNELLVLSSVASAVNQVQITNAITATSPIIEAEGETNVDLTVKSKGTGDLILTGNNYGVAANGVITATGSMTFSAINQGIFLLGTLSAITDNGSNQLIIRSPASTGSTIVADNSDNPVVEFANVGSSQNSFHLINSITAAKPILRSDGEANIGLTLADSNNNEVLALESVASAVNFITITNSVTGSPSTVAIAVSGTDTNTHLNLTSKGSGVVQINGVEAIDLSSAQILTTKTLTTPIINQITTLGLNDTDSAFELFIASTSTLLADRTLTFDVNDASRTLTISGDSTISGTNTGGNTGDQTATLAAGVGLSGTTYDPDTASTFALDFSELTDMTGDVSGTTEVILQDAGTESRKTLNEVDLSAFVDDIEKSKSITIESPDNAEDITFFFTNKAITITEIRAVRVGGTTATWTVRHESTPDRTQTGIEVVTGGTTTTSATAGSDVTTFNDATIPADSFVWIETSGTVDVDELHITIFYTED